MPVQQYTRIHVVGPDAFEFLQGQLSNDLRRLPAESSMLAAWCNPKGRVITLMRVASKTDGYTLDFPADLENAVLQKLTLFRFRAKVTFTSEALAAQQLAGARSDLLLDWQRANLQNGVVEIGAKQSEKYTPHMLNLDLIDALSLDKGCYTGQEIVARTHYRGASRRRLLRFTAEFPVSAGDDVFLNDAKIGDVVNTIDNDLLAVVPTDSADASLTCAGAKLQRAELPYSVT